MPDVYICVDALKPSDTAIEQAYSLGPGPDYTAAPVLIDPVGDGQQTSLLDASNTFGTWFYSGFWYKLVSRQISFGLEICKSTDGGATWTVLDAANSPAFARGSGYFDLASEKVLCVYISSNTVAAPLRLVDFDLRTETWMPVHGAAGAPLGAITASVVLRPDNTLLCMTNGKSADATTSGISGAAYDIAAGTWGALFDIGANLAGIAGWNSALTAALPQFSTQVMGSDGVVHFFFNTSSSVFVPVWGNRCFYQAVNLDNSLGSFTDFPGQTAPFPPAPYNSQQLNAFEGSPMGTPVIVGDFLVLPVLMRNDSVVDRFPRQLVNVYVGTPVSAPVWSLNSSEGATIDPGALVDDFIWGQQSPMAAYDGTTIYCVYPAQDEDGQNFARLRLCQTTNLANPADPASWTAATIYDLQVDASAPFQFPSQRLSGASIALPGGSDIAITCGSPPAAQVGVPYSHTFPVTGGTAPFTFSLTSGALPEGLTLNTATGTVSGTPTRLGLVTFSIRVVDSAGGSDTVSCSILVYGSVIITLYGWKLYPIDPCGDSVHVPECPSVDRAV